MKCGLKNESIKAGWLCLCDFISFSCNWYTFTNLKVTQMRNEQAIEYVRTHDSGKIKVIDGTFNKPSKKVIAEIEAKHKHVTKKFVWPLKGGRYRVTITYK